MDASPSILQPFVFIVIIGAGETIRTSDLLITNQLLYQLSYTGNGGALYGQSGEGPTLEMMRH